MSAYDSVQNCTDNHSWVPTPGTNNLKQAWGQTRQGVMLRVGEQEYGGMPSMHLKFGYHWDECGWREQAKSRAGKVGFEELFGGKWHRLYVQGVPCKSQSGQGHLKE